TPTRYHLLQTLLQLHLLSSPSAPLSPLRDSLPRPYRDERGGAASVPGASGRRGFRPLHGAAPPKARAEGAQAGGASLHRHPPASRPAPPGEFARHGPAGQLRQERPAAQDALCEKL